MPELALRIGFYPLFVICGFSFSQAITFLIDQENYIGLTDEYGGICGLARSKAQTRSVCFDVAPLAINILPGWNFIHFLWHMIAFLHCITR